MDRSRAFERLFAYQDRIAAQIDKAEALFAFEPDVACPQLAKLRWGMVRLLREYQLFKHTEIYDPVIASSPARSTAIARGLKAQCIAASERYATHVRTWSMADVPSNWDDYRAAFRAMADALREHLASERRGTQAILAGRDRTRQQSALKAG